MTAQSVHEILVVALGPDDGKLLTLGALETLREAKQLILRTGRHAAASLLQSEGIAFETLDALYESSGDFDELTAAACERLLFAAGRADLCYAVSDPVSDATVRQLAKAVQGTGCLRVLGGVSLAENAACAALACGADTENLRSITALSLSGLRPSADVPLVITEINDARLAADVKLWLSDLYDDEMTVYFLRDAAQQGCGAEPIPLYALDRQPEYDHRTAVFVPAVSFMQRQRADFEDLIRVVARLRGPGGCPWDRKQTHETLRRYMIEEACEAAEAMDAGDPAKLADELGDVLLQVALNSRIGEEHRAFTDRDVTSAIVRKMILRHPHVFAEEQVRDADDVNRVWEAAKEKERGVQNAAEQMAEVPVSLPALMRAQKVLRRQRRAKGLSADAADARQALCRFAETVADEGSLGTMLEAACALADALSLDAETCLRTATSERIRRETEDGRN
ncbi:MAG: MazG family protein [Clostridia bacterium]|nr:MazG family protein [Clostridia bacterium]